MSVVDLAIYGAVALVPTVIATVAVHNKAQKDAVKHFQNKATWEGFCEALDAANIAYECGFKWPFFYVKLKNQWLTEALP